MAVRKRLGDLCEWKTRAFKPALSLVRSIERFLDEFAPDGLSGEDSILWEIPLRSSGDTPGTVGLKIDKKAKGWKINAGEVEAILSIWMANLEAHNTTHANHDKNMEWQRSKAGVALGVDYCRILGRKYDNGVLERDINCSKHKNVKIVIGYTEPTEAKGPQTLLVQHSTAATATIVVQHLFTHFIWTIVDRLPKHFLGQGPPMFMIIKSGIGRKLSHQNLTKFVLHAEKEDLGTFDDVLLCLIPVFSIKDRLPNDATFQFDLSGFPERRSWPKAASNYSALLKSMSKSPPSVTEDSLTLTEVAYALDYIYMMALDAKHSRRDEYTNTNKEAKQQESLGTKNSRTDSNTAKADFMISGQQSTKDLQDLQTYISKAFPGALNKMWLFYKLQGRAEFFLELKESCHKRTKEATWLLEPMSQDMKVFMEQIRFTKLHQQTSNNKQIDLGELQEKKFETRDVFGWTALHYAAACDDLQVIGCSSAGQAALSDEKRPKDWWFDNFGRSPIHIACLSGNLQFLNILLANSSDQDVRSALQYRGVDGMTPVHLAVVGGHEKCLQAFFKLSYFYELDFKEDAWKRSPVHLAIAQGKYSCCTALLENGELEFKPSTLDTLGKSALSYLDEKNDEDKLLTTLQEKHERSIDSVNRAQESPLHLAVHRKNDELVGRLLSMGAHLSTNKDKSQSPLMLACSLGRLKMVKTMLESKSRAAEDQDGKGKLALHYVAESRECDDEVRPEIMNRLVEAMRNADMKSIDVKDNHGRTPLHIATENANISAVSTLISSGADPNTKDKDGANALHYALSSWRGGQRSAEGMQKITQSLLTKAPACMDATDNMGSTPLTLACRMGKPLGFIHHVVELSKQKGSKINFNQPDGLFGQSPLTWACEMEEKAIVMTLLESAAVDLSQRSTGYMGYTPLHFALKKKNQQIVQMLVCNPKRHADIDVPSSESPDLIEFACRESDRHCIETLLLHPEAKSSKFLTSAWKRAVQQPSRIADMTWFVHEWEVAILEPQNNVPFPLHELAEVGRLETFHSLLQDEKLHHQFDDNGWTPVDVASKYRHNDLAEFLRKNEPPRDVKVDPYAEPSTFVNLFRGPELETSTCHSHDQCFHENLDITLPKNDPLHEQFCYLRTKQPVPPNVEYFYFEVKIIRPLEMKECAVGFCQEDVLENRLPGWDEGSFAYHGDDGGFYVSNASGDPQENDEIFDKDDVVGCGLNLKTGHGYRSKNGVLLGSSHRFQETQFSTGRFYPWIAAKTNGEGDQFKVQVTLRSSEEHPFQYKGSYNGGLLRNE
ncbi:unnamed protein product [Fusarium graminearum]|nr:unnamed protein product [Fusarium graminearum]